MMDHAPFRVLLRGLVAGDKDRAWAALALVGLDDGFQCNSNKDFRH